MYQGSGFAQGASYCREKPEYVVLTAVVDGSATLHYRSLYFSSSSHRRHDHALPPRLQVLVARYSHISSDQNRFIFITTSFGRGLPEDFLVGNGVRLRSRFKAVCSWLLLMLERLFIHWVGLTRDRISCCGCCLLVRVFPVRTS